MKNEIKFLIKIIIAVFVIYGLGYFFSGKLNPMEYPTYGKIFFILFLLFGINTALD